MDGTSLPSGSINANNFTIINVANPVNPQDAATKSYVDTPTGNKNMGGYQINNLGAGTTANDAVTYAQLSAATGTSSSTLLAAMNYYAYTTFFGV